jgi:TolA-binding protein
MTPPEALRAKAYDPLETLREQIRELQRRVSDTEERLTRLSYWREKRKRYTKLRQFRIRAIRSIVALDRLTFDEIGQAFGISRQRAEQIAKRKARGN